MMIKHSLVHFFSLVFSCFRLGRDQKEYIDRRGVHVVVGHYMGDANNMQNPPNLTDGEFYLTFSTCLEILYT
jgi:hypothetical protein